MPREDDGACARPFTWLDEVDLLQALALVCCPQLICQVVISHAASVNH